MPTLHPIQTPLASAVVDFKLDRLRDNRRQINLILAFLALQLYLPAAPFASQRAWNQNRFVDAIRSRSSLLLAISQARLSPRRFRSLLRLSLREWSRLTLSGPKSRLQRHLELLDLALQTSDLPILLRNLPITPLEFPLQSRRRLHAHAPHINSCKTLSLSRQDGKQIRFFFLPRAGPADCKPAPA
jgi:hypothetical protein